MQYFSVTECQAETYISALCNMISEIVRHYIIITFHLSTKKTVYEIGPVKPRVARIKKYVDNMVHGFMFV